MKHNEVCLSRLTAEEIRETAGSAPGVILPLASVEILGKHGPAGLDGLIADYVSRAVAEKTGCLAAPTVPYGDTLEFGSLPGTVHIPARVLEEYIYHTALSLFTSCGFKAVLFLSVHSIDNVAAQAAARRLKAEGYTVATADWWAAAGSLQGVLEDPSAGRGHGSEMITSVALAVCPECMHMDRAVPETPREGLARVNRWSGTPFRTFGNFAEYCESGAWGNMNDATAEKGRLFLEHGIRSIVDFIREAF